MATTPAYIREVSTLPAPKVFPRYQLQSRMCKVFMISDSDEIKRLKKATRPWRGFCEFSQRLRNFDSVICHVTDMMHLCENVMKELYEFVAYKENDTDWGPAQREVNLARWPHLPKDSKRAPWSATKEQISRVNKLFENGHIAYPSSWFEFEFDLES